MTGQPPKSKRRWFQFSLRTLLIAVTLAALLCAVAAYWYRSRPNEIVGGIQMECKVGDESLIVETVIGQLVDKSSFEVVNRPAQLEKERKVMKVSLKHPGVQSFVVLWGDSGFVYANVRTVGRTITLTTTTHEKTYELVENTIRNSLANTDVD